MNRRLLPLFLFPLAGLPLAACAPGAQPVASSTSTASQGASADTSHAASPTPAQTSASASPAASAPVDCRKLKCIALTYDDGPSELTPKLLKAFTDRGATATLFMLGNAAEAHPQTVRQAHAEGFEVANHTYDHKPLSDLDDQKVAWEVRRTNEVLTRLTGRQPTLLRPPYAARTQRTDRVAGSQGLAVVVWNNSPEDWLAANRSAARITELTLARSSRNSIILMHDIHPWTVDAAPKIIDGLQRHGYTLVTVSQLLGSTRPGVLYPAS